MIRFCSQAQEMMLAPFYSVAGKVLQDLTVVFVVGMYAAEGYQACVPEMAVQFYGNFIDGALLFRFCDHGKQHRAVNAGVLHGMA